MFNLFWYITGKNRRFYKMPIRIIWGQISNLSPRFPEPFNVLKSTPHGSGLVPLRSTILRMRGPCIRTFLNSLRKNDGPLR